MVNENAAINRNGIGSPSTLLRPQPVHSNVHTVDITKQFTHAVSTIPAGTLIKDDQFTLFEAVGALEVGDPKMDSGCLENGEDLDHVYDFNKSLRPAEVLWLMDELLSREVAWHMGYPLSQTLFTSVYVDSLLSPNPIHLSQAYFGSTQIQHGQDPLLHDFFRAYCLGLIKSCDLVMNMVKSQHYYEEEDFATQLFNRDLLHQSDPAEILAMMSDALSWLAASNMDFETISMLRTRMSFRLELLQMLCGHLNVPEKSLSTTLSHLSSIEASMGTGISLPDAFSPKIQRRLASTIPPRPMVTIDNQKACDFWRQTLKDISNAFSLMYITNSNDLLTAYSTLNAQTPQPSAYVRALMQSFLSHGNKVCGQIDTAEFIIHDIRTLTLPGSDLLRSFTMQTFARDDSDILTRQHIQGFTNKIEQSYLNIYRTLNLNRCRMRRTLCHAVAEWDQIQADAEELDEELQGLVQEQPFAYPPNAALTYSYPLSSWIYHYKLIQIRLVVQMGFELSVYAPYELPNMYWYLSYISSTHLAHLERMSFFISRREAALPPLRYRNTSQDADSQECRDSLQLLYRHFSLLKATEVLSRALQLFYVVIQRQGQLSKFRTTYASDELRFDLRMRPFQHLSIPEPLEMEFYKQSSNMTGLTDSELLDQAASASAAAKKAWEEVLRAKWNATPMSLGEINTAVQGDPVKVIDKLWTDQVRGAVKATIATSIGVGALKQHLLKKSAQRQTAPKVHAQMPHGTDNDYWHPWWLVPRLSYG